MDEKWNKEEEIEQSEPLDTKLVVIIILGLAVLAAMICVGLWYVTHMGRPDQGSNELLAQATEKPSDSSAYQNSGQGLDSTSAAMPEVTSEPGQTSSASAAPEHPSDNGSEAGTSHSPEESVGADGGSVQGESTGANTGNAQGESTGANTGNVQGESTGTNTGNVQGELIGNDTGNASGQPSESMPEPTAEAVISSGVQTPDENETAMGKVTMEFTATKESVMPKDVVNLRSAPTTTDDGNIVTQIQNGDVIVRMGINENTGWSMVEYKDQKLYAVSQYLTTDLNYQQPVPPSDPNRVSTAGGRVIVFTNCDDWISPKEYVNLRTEPSTSEGDHTIDCQLYSGQKVHRTGYSGDSGWSRVEYGDKVLYVVTSFMVETEAAE
ncbi:MAG: hypothetical protein HFH82_04185 [Lachnospiraceae bacterium]|nr:hypothetical protein [Lachnospiraceae bacterium]